MPKNPRDAWPPGQAAAQGALKGFNSHASGVNDARFNALSTPYQDASQMICALTPGELYTRACIAERMFGPSFAKFFFHLAFDNKTTRRK